MGRGDYLQDCPVEELSDDVEERGVRGGHGVGMGWGGGGGGGGGSIARNSRGQCQCWSALRPLIVPTSIMGPTTQLTT